MMSTALLISAGAEQASTSSASAGLFIDQGEAGGVSFAKSLTERVDVPVLLATKGSAGDERLRAGGSESAPVAMKSANASVIPDKGAAKAPTDGKITLHNGLKVDPGVKNIPQTQAGAAVPQPKILGGSVAAQNVETAPETEPADSAVLGAAPLVTEPTETVIAPVTVRGNAVPMDRSSASDGGVAVQKEVEAPVTTKESDAGKKTAKTQGSAFEPKTGERTVDSVAKLPATESKPAAVASVNGLIPANVQPALSTVASPNDIGKLVGNLNYLGKSSSPGAKAAISPPRSDVVQPLQAGSTEAEGNHAATAVMAAEPNGPIPAAQPGGSPEKVTAVPRPGGTEDDGKTRAVSGPVAQLMHAISGGVENPSSAMTGVIGAGNAQGDLSSGKVPVAASIVHTAGSSPGLREQDAPGVASQTMYGMPRMLGATPTSLEVGVQDGTHGWLKVRAEMADGGVVNASVSAASSAGQEMLHRELPALTAFLQQEKISVSAVVVHTPPSLGADARGSSGSGNTGGEMPQRGSQGGDQPRYMGGRTAGSTIDEAATPLGSQGIEEGESFAPGSYAIGGGWLSVRA